MTEPTRGPWLSSLELLGFVVLVLAVVLTIHAVLYKRDERAAVAWVAVIWLAPMVGPIAYLLLGINRIRRRASRLRPDRDIRPPSEEARRQGHDSLVRALAEEAPHLQQIATLGDQVSHAPLTPGNRVTPLVNGEAAYPAMIEAIDQARRSVALATYIFNDDEVGKLFVEALGSAVDRGVEVRVLIDGVGSYYSWPPIVPTLQRRGVRVGRFLHSLQPWRMPFLNLRNHQKILVTDGRSGFTGGMNIKRAHLVEKAGEAAVQDLHFEIDGPVVAHLMEAFADDWAFTTGERLEGERWFPPIEPCGPVVARGIPSGPDEDYEKLRWILLGALATARRSVKVVTPYFLPDQTLVSALGVAAMSGVAVDIVIPERSNLVFIDWAAIARLEEVLKGGARLWVTPPPFDHSKMVVVDDLWSLIGSANWDPRSFRLNFELNVECFDPALATALDKLVQEKIAKAQPLTLAEVTGRSLPVKLRDGIARLFTPYL